MLAELIISFLVLAGYGGFLAKRLMTYLHAYQQEEYDSGRFIKWLLMNKVFDKKLSLILAIIGCLWFFLGELDFLVSLLVLAAFGCIGYLEADPRKKSKKKLAMTARAKRIYTIAFAFAFIPGVFVFFIHLPWIWIVLVQFIPLALTLANASLKPYEEAAQNKFWNEAHDKLNNLKPIVIGITGSYGKTSVKHILGHILSNIAPTLITPGSVNTPMGITRIIREELDETHKYFIAEMGAYGIGSIERLCKLCPPDTGIITAIGHAHYERFKSLDAVAEAKFELAQSVLSRSGKMIVHQKTLRFDHSAKIKNENSGSFFVIGDTEDSNVILERAEQTLEGLDIRIRWKDEVYALEVPLFGLHHADNVALAFVCALTLGIDAETIGQALKTTPQIPHRLEVKKLGATTLIDDAYNSNPLGFRSALDLLYILGQKKRKILITPGMVELGATHDDVHRQIGRVAAHSCNVAIAVNSSRIPSFVQGFRDEAREDQILYEMDTFAQAQEWIQDNRQEGDVILLENDLPDVYERVPKL